MARPDSWFRFYNTTLDNPKAQRLSGDMFKHWVNLLCLASKCGGKLPSNEDIAFALRVSLDVSETLLAEFQERLLVDYDGENFVMHDWNDLQFKSDVSTDRVKRYRERNKKPKRNVSRNGNETAQEQTIAEENRGDAPKAPKGAVAYPKDFEAWWEVYPHKVAKDAALKAWQKAIIRVDLETLIAAAKTYISRKPIDVSYANPATWLNGGRWQDAPAAATPENVTQIVNAEESQWEARCKNWVPGKFWNRDQWGPAPNEAGCKAPKRFIAKPFDPQADMPDFMRREPVNLTMAG